ncbi:hypothetical protein ACVJGD_007951 [Bradyrhizobium sp. USDA 10063]
MQTILLGEDVSVEKIAATGKQGVARQPGRAGST